MNTNTTYSNTSNQTIIDCVEQGINYLNEHQLPNGEFCCYYAPDDEMQDWCVPDSVVFFTSLISTAILPLRDHLKVKHILISASAFISYQMMRGGVWNYFSKWNPLFEYTPADIDDTVFASHVLKTLEIKFNDNIKTLLANRNSKGLFYTWFIMRPKFIFKPAYFSVMLRELKRPFKALVFWMKHESGRNDIDAVVNANVLFYLGLNEQTAPVVQYLTDVVLKEKELSADKWYKNPITLYYFISRNYSSVKAFEQVKQTITDRIFSFYQKNGRFANSAMETAMAVSALINFGCTDERLNTAVNFLMNEQEKNGSWKRHIFFYSGHSKKVGWGSEEFTTAYCIEALNLYRTKVSY